MKKITLLLLVGSFLFAPKILAQSEIDIQELLDRLAQNYMGSISDVFSSEELQILRTHLSETNGSTDEPDFLLTRKLASTKGNTPVNVVRIDPVDLSLDFFGASPLTQFEGAGVARFDPTNNVYVIDNDNTLHIRGVENNSYTNLGTIMNIPPGESVTGAEQTSNGDIFIISTNGMDSSHLFMLNPGPGTPQATAIGGNNGLILPINLARDGSDNLFVLDIDDDNVYGVDKTTGVATVVGSAGFDANFGQGAAYDQEADVILLAAFNAALGDSELRQMNPTTGLTTSLGTITPGTVDQFGWIGAYDADLLNVNDLSLDDFSFYPNPATNILHVNANTKIEQLTIYSISGQKIMEESLGSNKGYLDIEHLRSGFYMLEVHLDGRIASYKFIKQ